MDAAVINSHINMARPCLAARPPGVYALHIRGVGADLTGAVTSIGKGILVGPLKGDGLYARHPRHMPALQTQVESGTDRAILLVTCEIAGARMISAVIGV